MLRYADGTPFPYGQDFLDVLVDAIDACTAMFEAADELDREQQRSTDARRDRDAEDKRLAELEKAIAQTISSALPAADKAPHSQRAAKRTLAAAEVQLTRLHGVAVARQAVFLENRLNVPVEGHRGGRSRTAELRAQERSHRRGGDEARGDVAEHRRSLRFDRSHPSRTGTYVREPIAELM